jgi:hypothetical protein
MPRPPGPAESTAWPTQLTAHVVTPGDDPRLCGYSVEHDVAEHGRFSETILLSLRGELPSAEECRALDLALTFMAPLSIAEAPVHAAALGHMCGARSSALVGIAGVALAERARYTLEQHAPLIAWLTEPARPFPTEFRATSEAERISVERLRVLFRSIAPEPAVFRHEPSRTAALLAVLSFAGLRRVPELEAVFVLASLAPTLAEAFAHDAGSFHQYPMLLPRIEYTEEPDAG